jgi:outer membrane immunogenic protein
MRTKLLLTAALALIGWTNMASAADLPARTYTKAPVMPEVFNWTGFYIGANGGGMWTHNDVSSNFNDGSAVLSAQTLAALAGTSGMNGSGGFGGVQIGYNWQTATAWVWGVEADIQGMSLNANRTSPIFTIGAASAQDFDQIHHDWFATFRGRVGYAANHALFYLTGGLAVADTRFSRTQTWSFADGCVADPRNNFGDCHVGSASKTSVGGTVGAGVEYAFAGNWSVKLEYLHIWLQDGNSFLTQNSGAAFVGPPVLVQRFNQSMNDSNLDLVRVGINYRFGAAPLVAKY